MNEVNIKNDFLETDLMKDDTISKIISDSCKKIDFLRGKMIFILNYLEIRIEEESKEEFKNGKLIDFYKTLKDEVLSLYNSKLESSFPMVKEGKIRTSLSLKVTTNKLLEYNISFSESINDILTSILCQQNLIILE